MRAVIIEDEVYAAKALRKLIQKLDASIEILAVLQSIDESVEWFRSHSMPDLAFMDIHLADGSSFAIFDEVNITCPVIFTTAYNEYALKAFEVNSIDYLLKPVNQNDLARAINKYKNMVANPNSNTELINKVIASIKNERREYKSYFLVPEKDKLIMLATADIAYIFTEENIVKAVSFTNRTYNLEHSLNELGEELNPFDFFRANRQFIIARKAVKDLTIWFGGKMAVNLSVATPDRIIVSKQKVAEIKKWVVV